MEQSVIRRQTITGEIREKHNRIQFIIL